MLKLLVKLALAAFIASAAWRLGSEYLTHVRFREAVREATRSPDRSEERLRLAILDQAARFGVPLAEEALVIDLDERHVLVKGTYIKPIEFAPGYQYPWTFDWTVETYIAPSASRPVSGRP